MKMNTGIYWFLFLWTPAMVQGENFASGISVVDKCFLARLLPSLDKLLVFPQKQSILGNFKQVILGEVGQVRWEKYGKHFNHFEKTMKGRRKIHIYWISIMDLVLFFLSWINYGKCQKITETKESNTH